MKRLLLNSSNIKPVNIRIVSNGVECADLKMLKENFCISDIKNVLDGRLVNWLNNIGERELAENVKNKFPAPESILGKEFELYQLLGIIGKDVDIREYAKVLTNEKDHQIFLKEIRVIPNLILEIYQQFPNKYTLEEWINFFQIAPTTEQVFDTLQIIEKQNEERIKQINEESKKKFRDFLTYLIEECCYSKCNRLQDTKNKANDWIESSNLNAIYKRRAKCLVNEGIYGYYVTEDNMYILIRNHMYDKPKFKEFNEDNFKLFLNSLLELKEFPCAKSSIEEYVNKFFVCGFNGYHSYYSCSCNLMDLLWSYTYRHKNASKKDIANEINKFLAENEIKGFDIEL